MYLKQIVAAKNKGMCRSWVGEIRHEGVTLRVRTRRENCLRYQTFEIIYVDAAGNVARTGPCPVASLSDRSYVTQHTQLKNAILTWLKQPDLILPPHVELAMRSLVNRNIYIGPLSDMLKAGYRETMYPCEQVTGVTLTPQRAVMVFPSIKGYFVRLDFRLKQKKYVTYFSITHPDRVMENAAGGMLPVVYTESRYGFILGARGLYTLLSGWYNHSTVPNVDMLKNVGPELLALINGDRRAMIDEFLGIVNGQVSTSVSRKRGLLCPASTLSQSDN